MIFGENLVNRVIDSLKVVELNYMSDVVKSVDRNMSTFNRMQFPQAFHPLNRAVMPSPGDRIFFHKLKASFFLTQHEVIYATKHIASKAELLSDYEVTP